MQKKVQKQIEKLKKSFHSTNDFSSRIFVSQKGTIGFVFLKSMIDAELFSQAIYLPIQQWQGQIDISSLINKILKNNGVEEVAESEIESNILDGKVILFSDFFEGYISVDITKYPTRTPSEPPTSPVIQGPREGFVEDFKTNMTLLRRRLHTKDLVFSTLIVGEKSQTKVVVSYIDGVADKRVFILFISDLLDYKTHNIQ